MKIESLILALVIGLFFGGQIQAAAFRGLGDLPGGFQEITAYGLSADGKVVFGSGEGPNADEAYRWTLQGGREALGTLPGGDASTALGVSPDGDVVVGFSTVQGGREAFRWTPTEGMVGLGDLPGGAFSSVAHSVSADGGVIVGSGATAAGEEACIWIHGTLFSLKTFLVDRHGLKLSGWRLTNAKFVSADGKIIVGYGRNPEGEMEAWAAHLDGRMAAAPLTPPKNLRIVFE